MLPSAAFYFTSVWGDQHFYFECFWITPFSSPFYHPFFLFSVLLTSIFLALPLGKMPFQSSWDSYIPFKCKRRPPGAHVSPTGTRLQDGPPQFLNATKKFSTFFSKMPSLHSQKHESHKFVWLKLIILQSSHLNLGLLAPEQTIPQFCPPLTSMLFKWDTKSCSVVNGAQKGGMF